ncbi:MAG: hypothetical protein ABI765_03250 [Gemmatimonadota bacterium]
MTNPQGGSSMPAQWDREALDRILKRAAELQAHERDTGESMTPDEVLKLGRDVGIPGQYLQQAMLEERVRTTAATPNGILDRWVGSAECSAGRVVRGEPAVIEQAMVDWLESNELLAIERRQPGRISWEPLRGMASALRRSAAALGRTQRPFMLSRASRVTGGVISLEPGYCHVTLTADLGPVRSGYVGSIAGIGAAGVATAGVLTVMTPFLAIALAPIPLVLGLGWLIGRQYGPVHDRTQLGLERALDHLEQHGSLQRQEIGPGRPGIVGMIAEELRKALKP